MLGLYDRIKGIADHKICPRHGERPVINVTNKNVMMVCCCTPFEIDCYHEVIEILSGEIEMFKRKKTTQLVPEKSVQ